MTTSAEPMRYPRSPRPPEAGIAVTRGAAVRHGRSRGDPVRAATARVDEEVAPERAQARIGEKGFAAFAQAPVPELAGPFRHRAP